MSSVQYQRLVSLSSTIFQPPPQLDHKPFISIRVYALTIMPVHQRLRPHLQPLPLLHQMLHPPPRPPRLLLHPPRHPLLAHHLPPHRQRNLLRRLLLCPHLPLQSTHQDLGTRKAGEMPQHQRALSVFGFVQHDFGYRYVECSYLFDLEFADVHAEEDWGVVGFCDGSFVRAINLVPYC